SPDVSALVERAETAHGGIGRRFHEVFEADAGQAGGFEPGQVVHRQGPGELAWRIAWLAAAANDQNLAGGGEQAGNAIDRDVTLWLRQRLKRVRLKDEVEFAGPIARRVERVGDDVRHARL